MSCFIRRLDDVPVGTETCSIPFNKYDVPDLNCFIILIIKLSAHRDVFNQKKDSYRFALYGISLNITFTRRILIV
jgi:hypothetical protein